MHNDDLAKLILRIACGGILVFHGVFKVFTDIQHVKDMVSNAGLPSAVAYGSIIGEFIAPLFLIAGFKTRIAALIIAFNMLMTVLVAHRNLVFRINDFGGWMIETNMLFMFMALAIVFAGAGRYSVSGGTGRWD
ncbi:MAG TPA: DoxX family protein [Ohtaekwangia sp.]|nr:DoxX family protein [Ohtaekwangia sp.]